MHEIAFTVGKLSIHWYGVFVALAFVTAMATLLIERKHAGLTSDNVFDLALIAIFGGVTGARLFYVVQFHDQFRDNLLDVIRIDKEGLVFYGGFIVALAVVMLYCKWKKLQMLKVLDIYAPAVAFGHVFGRIGCFMQGCCFGKPLAADSAFPSVVFPAGSAPAVCYPANPRDLYSAVRTASESMPLIPVQLYESFCNLLIGVLLIFLLRKVKRPGGVAAIYLAAYAVMRFTMELMRGDHTDHIGVFTPSQAVAVFLMIPASAVLFWYAGRRYRNAAE